MSLVGKPGFRETKVGWIPEDWQPSTLGDAAFINPCRTKPESDEDEVSFLAMGDVSEDGRVITRQVRIYAEVAKGFTSFIDNDVLVAKITPCFENGKGALVTNLLGGIGLGSTEFHVVRAKSDRATPAFLNLHTRSDAFRRLGERNMVGSAGQKRVPAEFLREYPVALPPLTEQQKIATILTAVDDKLDVIARQIEATQTLKQGLMQTLFSRGVGTQDADGRWVPHAEFKDSELGEIPAGWTLMPLEELAVENITYGVVQPGESVEGGIPLVRGGDIKSGRIAANLRTVSTEISNQFKRTILKGGELLVSLVGYPGETAVVPSRLAGANIARQAGMIRTGSVSTSEFIHYYLSSPVGKSYLLAGMIGSAQQVINLKVLREVLIPVPSVAERERICSICSAVTQKLRALEDKQSSFQDLKRGLMQKLLTGEWRVSVDVSATGT